MLKYFTVVLIGLALMLVATPASAQEGGDDAAAAESGIAYNTARATLGTVFEKLGTKNQASAVATAIHYELITAEECLAVI